MSGSDHDPDQPTTPGEEPVTEVGEPPTEVSEPVTEVKEPPTRVSNPAAPDAQDDHLPRGRRYAVRTLLVLATIVGIVALLAVWVNRQALNADNWANTSSSMLENKEIRKEVSTYIVDQVYANVNVAGEVKSVLPNQLDPLAGEAASALQGLAVQAVEELLSRPFIQQAWKESNRLTMQQMINIVEEKQGGLVGADSGSVIINLRPLVTSAVTKLGLPANLTNKIPANAGSIKVVSSDDIAQVQSYAKVLRGLGLILPIVAGLLFVLAMALARGRRRKTLLVVGVDLIVIGVVVLVATVVSKGQVVDSLASTDAVKPAVAATWDIATEMLRDIAWATIITGLPLILAALLAGPTEPAVATRRALAPWLRDQLGVAYGVVAFVIILLIVWGPLHWMQEPVPVLLMILLVVAGVEVLRRQTEREFPDAQLPDAGAALGRWASDARDTARRGQESISSAVSARRAASGDGTSEPAEAPAAAAASDVAAAASSGSAPAVVAPAGDAVSAAPAVAAASGSLDQLERLANLHDRGFLSDEEFAEQKRKILGA